MEDLPDRINGLPIKSGQGRAARKKRNPVDPISIVRKRKQNTSQEPTGKQIAPRAIINHPDFAQISHVARR